MPQAALEDIRSRFPALRRHHGGHPVAYFDAPGGTQVPRGVADAMVGYLFGHNANTHWAYPTSEETDAILAAAREAAADLLGASPAEVVFGNNMTSLTFHLARTLGRTWRAGDEVVVTELDHHANVDPWHSLARDFGVLVRTARMVPETGQIDYQHLASQVSDRTRLLAVGGASNALGTVNDLPRVATLARAAGAWLFVDAVHLAPHEPIDVAGLGCDFLACSAYKLYGPHAGFLFVRRELLESLPFPKIAPAPGEGPERAETGTQNHEGIAGIGAMVEFLAGIGGEVGPRRERLARAFTALAANGRRQVQALWDGLAALPRVRLYGPAPPAARTPTVAFTIDGLTSEDVARRLAAEGLFCSHGDFYAATVVARLGVEGLVRAGCACYTTDAEVARLLVAVERIAGAGRKLAVPLARGG
jgi:cysteine desulfurase family protein (TIGR01976 family)